MNTNSHKFPRSSQLAARSSESGITLIDTLFGTALMLLIFVGIAGGFKLSVDVVTNNKARAGAIALANERMEYIRSLSYNAIGTSGGIPAGGIAQSENIASNSVSYTRRTFIAYADDPADGTGASDANGITVDYKIGRVDVSWNSRQGARHITLVGRVSPPTGMEAAVPGGTLEIIVQNATMAPVPNAQVHILNSTTNPAIDITTYTNNDGIVIFAGAPVSAGYQVTAAKTGYSTDGTYNATAQNTNPSPGPLTVSNNQTTTGTFRIDLVSLLAINTYSDIVSEWEDIFNNESKIGLFVDTEVSGNQVRFEGNQPYPLSGEVRSIAITPSELLRWGEFSWNDTRPGNTWITYRLYYSAEGGPALLPDSALSGNAAGFTTSPVDLSAVSAGLYPTLYLHATLSTGDPNAPSPSIQDWQITYEHGSALGASISMHGDKTIGSGPDGVVYKYNNSSISTAPSGTVTLSNLEWDTYTMSVVSPAGYTLSSACPSQPMYIAPNSSLTAKLFFSPATANSLLVDVKNSAGAILPGASVHIVKGGSYDETTLADTCGHAFFSNLTNGVYDISVSNPGNQNYSDTVNITEATRLSAVLN